MNAVELERPIVRPRAGSDLRIGARNVRGGLVLVSVGFLAGLAMSLYAFQPMVQPGAALDQYDDLPRRMLRLAHIAAIMLPLINVVFGAWLDRLRLSHAAKEWASRFLLIGAVAVPLALGVEACWAPARAVYLSAIPVIGFCSGIFIVSVGATRTRF